MEIYKIGTVLSYPSQRQMEEAGKILKARKYQITMGEEKLECEPYKRYIITIVNTPMIITNRDKLNELSNKELKNFIYHGGLNRFNTYNSSEDGFEIWLSKPYDERE